MTIATRPEATEPSVVDQIKLALVGSRETTSESVELRSYSSFDVTPYIGTEFRGDSKDGKPILSIADILKDDAKLKALARLVSERGVVFFQDSPIEPEAQKILVQRLGELSGKPASSKLHVHPLTLTGSEHGDEISVISNQFVFTNKFLREESEDEPQNRIEHALLWHTDITFEHVSSDYASLVIRSFPSVGGDTLWASSYEAYDRLSPAYRKFLEGLTATHVGTSFIDIKKKHVGVEFRENRGSPENGGQDLVAVHPVIRTNPVTGWKGIFVNRGFTKKINELTRAESDRTLDFLFEHISSNHDLQVWFRWEANSLAIWDNRSTNHSATIDLEALRASSALVLALSALPRGHSSILNR